ncbi:transporter [bacterium]|nr:MAG: transporter [bacterium]
MKLNKLIAFLMMCTLHLQAQDAVISDNSFLIEEAYNQEPRVVQHISNLSYAKKLKEWEYALTQEWPLFTQTHQLSYSIPYTWLNGNSVVGFGDVAVNYRYQLWDDARWAAISPRLTVILPTGDKKKGLGSGKTAYQVNLPLSKRISPSWVLHVNAGAAIMPGVSSGTTKETLWSYNAGASVIWLVKSNFNVLVEFVSTFDDEIMAGQVKNSASYTVIPGFRYAHNLGSLQIVPGLGVPMELSGKKTKRAFFYLSLEHPF